MYMNLILNVREALRGQEGIEHITLKSGRVKVTLCGHNFETRNRICLLLRQHNIPLTQVDIVDHHADDIVTHATEILAEAAENDGSISSDAVPTDWNKRDSHN